MFQGRGSDSDILNKHFGFTPSEVDYVVLSHAHIDHTGLLPLLVKEGFRGKIICTPATRDLCKILLLDSAHIQESDTRYLHKNLLKQGKNHVAHLYDTEAAHLALSLFRTVKCRTEFYLCKWVKLLYTKSEERHVGNE